MTTSTCTQLLSSVETPQQGDGEVSGPSHDNYNYCFYTEWRNGRVVGGQVPLSHFRSARNPRFV